MGGINICSNCGKQVVFCKNCKREVTSMVECMDAGTHFCDKSCFYDWCNTIYDVVLAEIGVRE